MWGQGHGDRGVRARGGVGVGGPYTTAKSGSSSFYTALKGSKQRLFVDFIGSPVICLLISVQIRDVDRDRLVLDLQGAHLGRVH